MPKPFQFRSGSLIYFRGDPPERVFILQDGKVSLVYQNIETGEDVRDQVSPGEFFGVKSALGHFPREENAVAVADSTVMAFTVTEFETLAMANTRIIMKMLKVFSNQMRRVHNQVSSLMANADVKPEEGLFNVGEYYLKNKRFSQAKYVFNRYLTYYPSGGKAGQAAKNIDAAEAALGRGEGKASLPARAHAAAASSQTGVDPSLADPSSESAAAKAYYDAVSLISQEKYQQAYLAFKKIVDANEDPEWIARSAYELGRCMFFLKKYEDCIQHYMAMLARYPQHPDIVGTLFYLGQCHEKNGKKGQAAAFYKKLIAMSSDLGADVVKKAKQALQALGG
jgi:CRP-like cAMP-binding protein